MSKTSKYSPEEKLMIINKYLNGEHSKSSLLEAYNICYVTLDKWIYRFEKDGLSGLKNPKTWKKYTKELKENSVSDYINGTYSIIEVVKKYEISDTRVLRGWIKKYNSHSELNGSGKGLSANMTKGRKTTYIERIEIVQFCIANNLDFQSTAKEFNVSYQQVYTWVRKYNTGGKDGLQDRRGKSKFQEELTDEDLLSLKLKKLEAENKRLKAENLLLKKLEEIERK